MKPFLTALFLAIIALATSAQTNVIPRASKDIAPQGIIYHLPKTTLKITAKASITVSKPGMFYQYAERFFAQKDIVVEESTEWKLISVAVKPIAEPNPKAAFEVKPDKKGNSASNFLSFTNNGIINGINLPSKHKFTKKTPQKKNIASNQPHNLTFNLNVLSEEVLVANSIPKMAELAAKQVYRIRESRSALINGEMEVIPNGEAMAEVLKRMDKMEEDLLALFFGKKHTQIIEQQFTHQIEDDADRQILFRLSTKEGFVAPDNIIGDAVYINIKGTYPLAPAPPEKAPKVLGFAYTVPGSALIEIYDLATKYVSTNLKVAQFGYTLHLNPSLTDNPNIKIKYNPLTGEIQNITK